MPDDSASRRINSSSSAGKTFPTRISNSVINHEPTRNQLFPDCLPFGSLLSRSRINRAGDDSYRLSIALVDTVIRRESSYRNYFRLSRSPWQSQY